MRISEAIARAVALEIGDAPVFALIGDANLRLIGAFDRYTEAKLCFARDEGAAVAMADGYAQASASLGIASVTSGPGLTHAATSLLAASRMRTSLVVVTGDTPMQQPVGLQAMMNIHQRRFAEACEAGFHDLRSPATLAGDIASAFDRARTQRAPMLLNVPLDLQTMDVASGWDYAPSHARVAERIPARPNPAAIAEVVKRIEGSRLPLILAGRGAVWAGARGALEELGDRIGALLGTTLLAKGYFDDSAWSLGVVGGYSSPAGMELIRDADLVLAFGAELGHFTTQGGSLFQGRLVVRIDHAPFPETLPGNDALALKADAKYAAEAIRDALADASRRGGFRSAATRDRLARPWPDEPPAAADGLLDPRALMRELGGPLPEGTRIVVGGGHFWSFPCLHLSPPKGGAFLCPLGAAAVGQALPFAIGVATSAPGRPVLAVEGDGSLLMNIQELDTAARHRLPLVLVVMNDGALSAEAIRLRIEGYDENLAVYPTPDFAAVARGFGWKAVTISGGASIAAILGDHRWSDGPLLIDARISRAIVVDPVAVKDLSRKR